MYVRMSGSVGPKTRVRHTAAVGELHDGLTTSRRLAHHFNYLISSCLGRRGALRGRGGGTQVALLGNASDLPTTP